MNRVVRARAVQAEALGDNAHGASAAQMCVRVVIGAMTRVRLLRGGRLLALLVATLQLATLHLGLVACTEKGPEAEGNAKKVVTSSEGDATAEIVDEDYRFKLAWPGAGWKMLHGPDAAKLMPNAVAGAVSEAVVGVVIVEPAPLVPIEKHATVWSKQLALTERKIESNEPLDFHQNDAMRFSVTGRAEGVPLRYRGIVFARGGHLYRLVAWSSADGADASAFSALFDAFSLTDGDVKGRSVAPAAQRVDGVGWRIVDGVFESAISGVRIKPPEGFRLVVGGELARINPDAEVGLVVRAPSLSLVLLSERAAGLEAAALTSQLEDAWRERFEKPDPKPYAAKLFGSDAELSRYEEGPREYIHGISVKNDRALQVLAQYRMAERDKTSKLVATGLGAMSMLSAAEFKKLSGDLKKSGLNQSEVGERHCIRGGTFLDFARGIVWTKPDGLWSIMAGRRATAVNHDAVMYAENRALGLYALIIVDERDELDAATYHKRVLSSMKARVQFRADNEADTKLAGLDARGSEGSAAVRGVELQYRVVTAVQDETALQLLVWGRPVDYRESPKQVKQIEAGVQLDTSLKAVERTTASYRNRRLGFEVSLGSPWTFSDQTRPELAPLGRFVRWENQGKWIGVLAVYLPDEGLDERWAVEYLDQLLRDEYAQVARGARSENEATLAGVNASHVTWNATLQRVDALVALRGRTAYAVMTVGSGADTYEQATRSFAFLK